MNEAVLLPGVAAVASQLGTWPAMQAFYLSGGTALALQLGHRQSRDLDFSTRHPLAALPSLAELDGFLTRFHRVEWLLQAPDQIHWRLDEVSVTLLAYPFAPHFSFHHWLGLAVADARDIAIQKAYALGRRAQARDYLDLHAVLKRGVISLDAMIRLAQDTYGEAFSPRLFLQQLVYTRDLPDRGDAAHLLVAPMSFDTVERDLQAMVRQWMAEHVASSDQTPPRGSDR